MDLQQYYHLNPEILEEKAFLEKLFLDTVFFQEFGKVGLDYLQYQKEIYDFTYKRNYKIDFVIEHKGKKIAIETDGYNFHNPKTKEEFEYQEERTNEITRQGYELIRYSHDKIKYHPAQVRKELRHRLPPFSIPDSPQVPTSPAPAGFDREVTSVKKTSASPQLSVRTTIPSSTTSESKTYQPSVENKSNGCGKTFLWIIVFLIVLSLINSRKQNSSSTGNTNPTRSVVATSKPTQKPNFRPSVTPIPTRIPSFMNHKLSINIGQTVTLSYDLYNFSEEVKFFSSPGGIIKVQQKSDNHTLTITGVVSGVTEILMKDTSGNIIDTCRVTVKLSTPTPTPINELKFEKNKLSIKVGERVQLKFNRPAGTYFDFRISNNNLRAEYFPNTDYILVTGLLTGTCKVSLISGNGAINTCMVTIIGE